MKFAEGLGVWICDREMDGFMMDLNGLNDKQIMGGAKGSLACAMTSGVTPVAVMAFWTSMALATSSSASPAAARAPSSTARISSAEWSFEVIAEVSAAPKDTAAADSSRAPPPAMSSRGLFTLSIRLCDGGKV